MTGMCSLTLVLANAADVNGLPALPFLSAGFLLANGDLLWRRLRPARASPSALVRASCSPRPRPLGRRLSAATVSDGRSSARSSSATVSTCGVCGNMSTGRRSTSS